MEKLGILGFVIGCVVLVLLIIAYNTAPELKVQAARWECPTGYALLSWRGDPAKVPKNTGEVFCVPFILATKINPQSPSK